MGERLLLGGALVSCAGIVTAATGTAALVVTAGGVVLLGGWLAMVFGVHRFGRGH